MAQRRRGGLACSIKGGFGVLILGAATTTVAPTVWQSETVGLDVGPDPNSSWNVDTDWSLTVVRPLSPGREATVLDGSFELWDANPPCVVNQSSGEPPRVKRTLELYFAGAEDAHPYTTESFRGASWRECFYEVRCTSVDSPATSASTAKQFMHRTSLERPGEVVYYMDARTVPLVPGWAMRLEEVVGANAPISVVAALDARGFNNAVYNASASLLQHMQRQLASSNLKGANSYVGARLASVHQLASVASPFEEAYVATGLLGVANGAAVAASSGMILAETGSTAAPGGDPETPQPNPGQGNGKKDSPVSDGQRDLILAAIIIGGVIGALALLYSFAKCQQCRNGRWKWWRSPSKSSSSHAAMDQSAITVRGMARYF